MADQRNTRMNLNRDPEEFSEFRENEPAEQGRKTHLGEVEPTRRDELKPETRETGGGQTAAGSEAAGRDPGRRGPTGGDSAQGWSTRQDPSAEGNGGDVRQKPAGEMPPPKRGGAAASGSTSYQSHFDSEGKWRGSGHGVEPPKAEPPSPDDERRIGGDGSEQEYYRVVGGEPGQSFPESSEHEEVGTQGSDERIREETELERRARAAEQERSRGQSPDNPGGGNSGGGNPRGGNPGGNPGGGNPRGGNPGYSRDPGEEARGGALPRSQGYGGAGTYWSEGPGGEHRPTGPQGGPPPHGPESMPHPGYGPTGDRSYFASHGRMDWRTPEQYGQFGQPGAPPSQYGAEMFPHPGYGPTGDRSYFASHGRMNWQMPGRPGQLRQPGAPPGPTTQSYGPRGPQSPAWSQPAQSQGGYHPMSPKEFHHYEPSDYPSFPEGQHDWHGQGHAPRAELGPKGGYPEGGGAWSHWPPRGEEPGGYSYPGAEESGRDFESTGGYSLGPGGESSGRNQGGAFQQHGHTGHTARAGQGPGWHPGGFGGAPGSARPHLNLSHEVGAPQSQAAGPHAGRGPKGYRRSDERIHEEICDRLTAHGAIDAGEIEVRVSSGEVTLEGPVESRRIKHLIELVCDEVPGVSDVHNHLKLVKK